MDKIEIQIYKFAHEDNKYVWDWVVFTLLCVFDRYLLKYFLVLINNKHIKKCSRAQGAIKQNCAQSNFHYLLTFVC